LHVLNLYGSQLIACPCGSLVNVTLHMTGHTTGLWTSYGHAVYATLQAVHVLVCSYEVMVSHACRRWLACC
jgi:hypothetical protein